MSTHNIFLNKTVSVVGLGYVGLPVASILASRNIEVVGYDTNQHVVDCINQGKLHIVEPHLDSLFSAAVTNGFLRAVSQPEPADVFVVAVPTHIAEDNKPDLSYVEASIKNIAPVMKRGNLIIIESTIPIGSTELSAKWIEEARPDLTTSLNGNETPDIFIAHCPERILPGKALQELVSNNRIIGGLCAVSARKAAELYSTFVDAQCIETSARVAELCKLTENSYRDVNIAFANELSMICNKFDIEAWEVIELANHHPRVNILQPGPGVGGHCIAIDPWYIVYSAPDIANVIRTARETNNAKPLFVADQIRERAKEYQNPVIAALGLSYKPDIDDLRESPSIEIIKNLAKDEDKRILAVDPHVNDLPSNLADLPNVELVTLAEALQEADVVAILVAHAMFRDAGVGRLRGKSIVEAVRL